MHETLQLTHKGERELVFSRHFNAPPDLVFLAHTTPALMQQWMLPPPGWTLASCVIDARVGGALKNTFRNVADGNEFAVSGTILEIERPHRFVHTEIFDFQDAGESSIEALTLSAEGAGTLMTQRFTYPSAEACAAALESGMIEGMEPTFAALDQFLRSKAA